MQAKCKDCGEMFTYDGRGVKETPEKCETCKTANAEAQKLNEPAEKANAAAPPANEPARKPNAKKARKPAKKKAAAKKPAVKVKTDPRPAPGDYRLMGCPITVTGLSLSPGELLSLLKRARSFKSDADAQAFLDGYVAGRLAA